jgi:hypothetical protein
MAVSAIARCCAKEIKVCPAHLAGFVVGTSGLAPISAWGT